MEQLSIPTFLFEENAIRTAGTQSEPLFSCLDVLKQMGYSEANQNWFYQKNKQDPQYIQSVETHKYFTEVGMYECIFTNDTPAAKALRYKIIQVLKRVQPADDHQPEDVKEQPVRRQNSDTQFCQQIDKLMSFYSANNRFPRDTKGIDKEEYKLASFRNKLKQAQKQLREGIPVTHYSLTAERVQYIDQQIQLLEAAVGQQVCFWALTEEQKLLSDIQEIQRFKTEFKRYPKEKQESEKQLLNIIKHWRTQYTKNSLPSETAAVILQHLPDFEFSVYEAKRKRNYDDLKLFVDTNKRLPKQAENKRLFDFYKGINKGEIVLLPELKAQYDILLSSI